MRGRGGLRGVWLRAVCGDWIRAVRSKKSMKSWQRDFLCPAGTGASSFHFVRAACVAASLLAEFWPPSRRAADGGLLGAAAPPRPPLHSPRTTPLGLPYPTSSSILLSSRHRTIPLALQLPQVARAARLLLRELPSLRSGDLPARRAMPLCAFALNGCLGASGCLGRFGMAGIRTA